VLDSSVETKRKTKLSNAAQQGAKFEIQVNTQIMREPLSLRTQVDHTRLVISQICEIIKYNSKTASNVWMVNHGK